MGIRNASIRTPNSSFANSTWTFPGPRDHPEVHDLDRPITIRKSVQLLSQLADTFDEPADGALVHRTLRETGHDLDPLPGMTETGAPAKHPAGRLHLPAGEARLRLVLPVRASCG